MKKPVISKPLALDGKLKVLLHAPSGVGKTRLASTFPRPIIFDFEQGTGSVTEDVAVIDLKQFQQSGALHPPTILEYLDWLATPEGREYETVVIDSITDLQEQFIEVKMPSFRDPRQAYGEWASFVRTMMTKLRALDKNFVVIARTKMGDNFEGVENTLLPQISPAAWTNIPGLVDYGFYMTKKSEGLGNAAKVVPVLVTQSKSAYTKTRSLLPAEIPSPTFAKLQAVMNGTAAG